MKKILFSIVFSATYIASFAALASYCDGKKCKHHDHEARFERADKDGNGFISKEEFLEHAAANFDKMDANGDGKLEKGEGKHGKKGHKGKH